MPKPTNLFVFDPSAPRSAAAVARATGATRVQIQELIGNGLFEFAETNGELLRAYVQYLRERALARGIDPDTLLPLAR